jgi:hypothetical protein
MADGQICWMIDWREHFRCRQVAWDGPLYGDLPEFQVIFSLRMTQSGVLRFWADDGCIVRRSGRIVHEDRDAHSLMAHEIEVEARRGAPLESTKGLPFCKSSLASGFRRSHRLYSILRIRRRG